MENNKKKSLIPKAALIKAWLIWETFPQTCYNYERMMGQVVAHMFSAIIGFLYKDDPSKRKEVMKREIEFFNVHRIWVLYLRYGSRIGRAKSDGREYTR